MGSYKIKRHVLIEIDPSYFEIYQDFLKKIGYEFTIMQVFLRGQLFGVVKEIDTNEGICEHHIRLFEDGTITSEIEPRRIKDMWKHLTTKSKSAHEIVINQLEEQNIPYQVDEEYRKFYNNNIYNGFPKDYFELVEWVYGIFVSTPIALLWRAKQKIKQFFNNQFESTDSMDTSFTD